MLVIRAAGHRDERFLAHVHRILKAVIGVISAMTTVLAIVIATELELTPAIVRRSR